MKKSQSLRADQGNSDVDVETAERATRLAESQSLRADQGNSDSPHGMVDDPRRALRVAIPPC